MTTQFGPIDAINLVKGMFHSGAGGNYPAFKSVEILGAKSNYRKPHQKPNPDDPLTPVKWLE